MMKIKTALGRDVDVNADYTVPQHWEAFTAEEHARWDTLYARQCKLLKGRACDEFIKGVGDLKLSDSGIPNYEELSERLHKLTGWQIVAVPDLVPDNVFFEHLANRRFPAANFIRGADQMNYLQEPDNFHDVFGHVPLLSNPVFADYLQAYGQGGLRADGLGVLHNLARLYWYTVEFGLINTPDGMRIYGAGIVSSKGESVFSLDDDSPNRVHFDLERLMRTNYIIDDYQQTYFVIDSFEELLEATMQDFAPIYDNLKGASDLGPEDVLASDRVHHKGTGVYAASKKKTA